MEREAMTEKEPRILILNNSALGLGAKWFGHWFRERLKANVSIYDIVGGDRIDSLAEWDGMILSGSAASATDEESWIEHELALLAEADVRNLPVLGVCFGGQLVARGYFGTEAVNSARPAEFGWHEVQLTAEDPLFEAAPSRFYTYQYHMEQVALQPGMNLLATNAEGTVQAFRVEERPVWGLQFHPEVTPAEGRALLRRTPSVYRPHGITYEDAVRYVQENVASEIIFRNFIKLCGEEEEG